MATEIATLKVNDTFTPQLCERVIDYLKNPSAPGLQSLGWGRTAEDPNTIIWVLNWDSVKAHQDFMEAPIYPEFVGTIMAFCSAPISLFHTYLTPFPPPEIFQAGVLELAISTRKPGITSEVLQTTNAKLLALAQKATGYHSHFQGVKFEDNNVHISLVAWDSLEAMESHTATLSNEALSAAANLIVSEASHVYHVKLQHM